MFSFNRIESISKFRVQVSIINLFKRFSLKNMNNNCINSKGYLDLQWLDLANDVQLVRKTNNNGSQNLWQYNTLFVFCHLFLYCFQFLKSLIANLVLKFWNSKGWQSTLQKIKWILFWLKTKQKQINRQGPKLSHEDMNGYCKIRTYSRSEDQTMTSVP